MFCASRRDVCMYIRPSINMYFQFGPSSILTSAMLMQLLHVQHGPISGYQVQVATLTWRKGQGRSTDKISRTQTASCAVGTKLPDGKEEGRNWVIERMYPSYIPSQSFANTRSFSILDIDHLSPSSPSSFGLTNHWTSHFRLTRRIL